ncbi:MAG: flippase-like domain-containing protein [Actinomycetota bacterium]|nr:flippase-like domain-containing protein [Actinomycetota bacterium]
MNSNSQLRIRRVLARFVEFRHRLSTGRRQRFWLALAAALFVAAFVVAFMRLPPVDQPIRWELFAVSGLLGAPLRLLLLAAEYDASARMMGHADVPFRQAIRISIFATAANLLPIPGSAIVRTAALHRLGAPVRGALLSTGTVALIWIATGVLLIGIALLVSSVDVFGVALCAGGAAALGGSFFALRNVSVSADPNSLFVRIVVIEAAFIALAAIRFLLILAGLGYSASVGQAAALTLSGMVATMTGVFPGGLGIREVAAGAVSALIDLPPSVGVIAAAVMRLADLGVMAPITFVALRQETGRRLVRETTSDSGLTSAELDRP